MYKPYKGGSSVEIGYEGSEPITVHLPPVGYVFDHMDKQKLVYTGVMFKDKKPADRRWKREPLPQWYVKARTEEERIQKQNRDYKDSACVEYRQQQWFKRHNGCWIAVYNPKTKETENVYLTGLHWFYIQWWKCDFGYPCFRFIDLEVFYLLQYCIEDPDSFGLLFATNRRFGKTAILGAFLYEYVTRKSNSYAGLQDVVEKDASEMFMFSIIGPWNELPHFFRPLYDYNSTQKKDLHFRLPTPRGKKQIEINTNEKPLNSRINYRDSSPLAYDRKKLHRYGLEEPGKTIDVQQRWRKVKPTHKVGKKIIGKTFGPTTIEEGVGREYVEMWNDSDFHKRNENNQTRSGLYRHFIPAYKGYIFDHYGRSVIDDPEDGEELYELYAYEYEDEKDRIKIGAYNELFNERKELTDDRIAYNEIIRKYPFSIKEALRISIRECLFNDDLLQERLEYVGWTDNLTTRGNFEWVDGIRDSQVEFIPQSNGKWLIAIDDVKKQNNVQKKGELFYPLNDVEFASGIDPYDHRYTSTGKQSKAASYVLKKFDPYNEAESMKFVTEYINRPEGPDIVYEDMIKQCFFFGCSVLIESQKPGIIEYFEQRGYSPFIMWLPGQNTPGMSAPQTTETKQYWTEIIATYINNHCSKMNFERQIKDLLKFDIEKTQDYDATMATGYTLVAARNKMYEYKEKPKPSASASKGLEVIFKRHKLKTAV